MDKNISELIETSDACMLYIGGAHCSVCKTLYPKLIDSFEKEFPKMLKIRIEMEDEKEFVASLQVFTIPTIIVYFEGKEFFRKSRNLSVEAFVEEVKRPYHLFIES